jgi:hypothetical protein
MEKWYKKDYVCSICDALIEMTTKSDELRDKTCIECYGDLTLLSVVDATISSTTKKEEQTMETTITIAETYNPNLLVTYKKIDGENITYPTQKVTEIEYALDQSRRNYNALVEKQNSWYRKESQLRTLLEEVYADSDEQDTLSQIAEIFDVPLTKEIEYTAWVRVDMTIEVELGGDVDAIEDFISSNLTVDSYDSAIQVTNHEVERTEEGAY